MHGVSVKQELVDAALLYNILDYTELGLTTIPEDKTCTDKPQQWNTPNTIQDNGPILFSEIQFVHHSYENIRQKKWWPEWISVKKYRACPGTLHIWLEDRIRCFCTKLESQKNASLFTTVLRGNDCQC